MISKNHLQLTETLCAIFEEGPRQLPHSPYPIFTTDLQLFEILCAQIFFFTCDNLQAFATHPRSLGDPWCEKRCSKIKPKNRSSSRIGLRFHPKQVIFLIEFNDMYLIAQKFVMQFLKIWLACPDRMPLAQVKKKTFSLNLGKRFITAVFFSSRLLIASLDCSFYICFLCFDFDERNKRNKLSELINF